MRHHVKSITAGITSADVGGFTAIASTPSVDRDGEVLAAACFAPLPESIPVHLDHTMNAANVIAKAKPYYRLNDLIIDATFSSSPEAQSVRAKVAEGTLDSISVVFRGHQWESPNGVRTLVKGELLAADIVSVPAQRDARVLSVRSYSGMQSHADLRAEAREAIKQATLAMAEVDIAEAKRLLGLPHRKRGSRNSASDMERLQQIHDMAVTNGATCDGQCPTCSP